VLASVLLDETVRVWATKNVTTLHTFLSHSISTMSFLPDGRMLESALWSAGTRAVIDL